MSVSRGALALALSVPVVVLPAVLMAAPAQAEQPVHPLGTGCGIELHDVRADAALARVRVVVLPGLQGVPLAEDGLLATRGTVQVPFSLPVDGEAVRVVLTLDGVDGPLWDVPVPSCAGPSTAPPPDPSPSPGVPAPPTPSPTPATTDPAPRDPGPTEPSPVPTAAPQQGPTEPSPAGPVPTLPVPPVPAASPEALPAPAPAGPLSPAGTTDRPPSPTAPGTDVGGPMALFSTALAPGGASVAALSAFAPMPMLASALLGASASMGVPAPVVAGVPGEAAVPLAVDSLDGTVLERFTVPTSTPTTVQIARAASGTPMTAVKGYVDLAPAAVLVAGTLGGLAVVRRRRTA